jgi:hypothetical protein
VTKGEQEKNYAEIAKRDNLKPLEVELVQKKKRRIKRLNLYSLFFSIFFRKMRLADSAENLKTEFDYAKNRELTHRDTSGKKINKIKTTRLF